MVDLHLLNFIVYNFLTANIGCVAIFNCWDTETQHTLSQITSNQLLYTQYINMDKIGSITDLENRFLKHKNPTMGIFFDMNCQNSDDILNETSRLRLFSDHFHWLLYDKWANLSNFQRLFVNANLSVNADLAYAMLNMEEENLDNTSYIQYDVYNNGRHIGGKLNITVDREIICNETSCQLGKYLSLLHARPKYDHRGRLEDVNLRVAVAVLKIPTTFPEEQLLEFLKSDNNTNIDSIARFGFKLTMIMLDALHCKRTFTYYDRWSSTEISGGTIGALITETADYTSTPFLPTASRLKYLSVLGDTGGFRSVCIFRTPRNTGIKGGVFLEPFSGTVWYCFGLILAIASIFLWSTFYIEYYRMRLYFGYLPSFLTTCLLTFGSACVQGSYLVPSSIGGRMAFFSLSLISFIMYNYYTSIVVSSLLGSPVKSNIKTLGQLADSSLEVALEPLPFTFVYLNASMLPDVRRFVKRKIESKKNRDSIWIPAEEGIRRVRDIPGYVFVFEGSTGYKIVEKMYEPHEICDLNEVVLRADKSLYNQLHKNSTYKELIRLRELRMLETGVYLKHRRQWVQTRLNCFANNFVIDVGMEYAAPLFFLLLSAYLLVFILLMSEIAYKRRMDKKKILMIADEGWERENDYTED